MCFLGQKNSFDQSHFVIIPVPYEATVSYGKGTKNGPNAIIDASNYLEEFDLEQKKEVFGQGRIFTHFPINVKQLSAKVKEVLQNQKIPVVLGGEHSLSEQAIKSVKEKYPDLSVLQLDAHADLRQSYQGRQDSHACVMRRVLDICPIVQAGVRSLSKEEYDLAVSSGQIDKIHFINDQGAMLNSASIIGQLSNNVYITIDVDVLDPSIMPSTGTPEPGGMLWNEILGLLKTVCREKNVVGFDVVELSPRKGEIAPDFMAAKLVFKLMGYIAQKRK